MWLLVQQKALQLLAQIEYFGRRVHDFCGSKVGLFLEGDIRNDVCVGERDGFDGFFEQGALLGVEARLVRHDRVWLHPAVVV